MLVDQLLLDFLGEGHGRSSPSRSPQSPRGVKEDTASRECGLRRVYQWAPAPCNRLLLGDPVRAEGSDRADRLARGVDVEGDLVDEGVLRRKHRLVAQAFPHLDDEPLAVEIAVEVEKIRLDPALAAAVMGFVPIETAARCPIADPA